MSMSTSSCSSSEWSSPSEQVHFFYIKIYIVPKFESRSSQFYSWERGREILNQFPNIFALTLFNSFD